MGFLCPHPPVHPFSTMVKVVIFCKLSDWSLLLGTSLPKGETEVATTLQFSILFLVYFLSSVFNDFFPEKICSLYLQSSLFPCHGSEKENNNNKKTEFYQRLFL